MFVNLFLASMLASNSLSFILLLDGRNIGFHFHLFTLHLFHLNHLLFLYTFCLNRFPFLESIAQVPSIHSHYMTPNLLHFSRLGSTRVFPMNEVLSDEYVETFGYCVNTPCILCPCCCRFLPLHIVSSLLDCWITFISQF